MSIKKGSDINFEKKMETVETVYSFSKLLLIHDLSCGLMKLNSNISNRFNGL